MASYCFLAAILQSLALDLVPIFQKRADGCLDVAQIQVQK